MTTLIWDCGTAYDLFISLDVLLNPGDYEIPASWAAGMRARLPGPARELLEQRRHLFSPPISWIHGLPAPKDGAAALSGLADMPPQELLPLLAEGCFQEGCAESADRIKEILRDTAIRGQWLEHDIPVAREFFCKFYQDKQGGDLPAAEIDAILAWWAKPAEFGARYLQAIQAYQEVFFAEEEKRIRPILEETLAKSQALAERLPLLDLLEELSQGVRFNRAANIEELVLAPSFWGTPLVFMEMMGGGKEIWLYGGRPAEISLIPGETVPDKMLQSLKALADPTRLRILRYLNEERLTPTQLAKRLRLRPPTVIHHLKILRLAGLIQLDIAADGETRTYAARAEATAGILGTLQSFLGRKGD